MQKAAANFSKSPIMVVFLILKLKYEKSGPYNHITHGLELGADLTHCLVQEHRGAETVDSTDGQI